MPRRLEEASPLFTKSINADTRENLTGTSVLFIAPTLHSRPHKRISGAEATDAPQISNERTAIQYDRHFNSFQAAGGFRRSLEKDCPKNDCTSYLYTYEQYCAIYADYKRIKETIADLSEATVRVLEHAIRKTEAEIYKTWFENYAVLKQREALGMTASAERRATSSGKTNFEEIIAGAKELGRLLHSLPIIEPPWDIILSQ